MSLEEQIISDLADEMMRSTDFEIFADMMVQEGWTRVEISKIIDNYHAIDMRMWSEEHCQSEFKHNGRTWIFQSESDAMWFKLKWQR